MITNNVNSGTEYSDWIPVPANKYAYVAQIVQGKKFQLRTDKKIDENNDIGWHLKSVDQLTLNTASLYNQYCISKVFTDDDRASKGFFQRAGVLTVLKTSTQLQIWFDDVLEVTWVFEDIAHSEYPCFLRTRIMTGLRFISGNGINDKVTTHYRYGLGEYRVA